jgi:hypothetical protein
MSSFPLYNNLIKDIPKKDLTAKQKIEFVNNITKIDSSGRDLVLALIQFFRIENESGITNLYGIPYNGISEKNEDYTENISWDIGDLPQNLRHVIYKFLNIHLKIMDESKKNNCPVF